MFEVREKPQQVERALLVSAYFDRREEVESDGLLDELGELVRTLGIEIVESVLVFVRDRNKRWLTGSGKAEELMALARDLNCDCIVFDNELLPSQQRAWEEEGKVCVIDRQEVILDIFKMRARSKEARLQVELARMEYSLPRLARMWTHLDRQGGGTGSGGSGAARGEGEKQIEVDRRLARLRIDRCKRELAEVRQQRDTQRQQRQNDGIPSAAIVGYTNAGKSSLLNKLAESDILAEDKLFATLDTTTRRVELPDGQTLLMTDTVGFVRNLPHKLVEAFKATLEEAVISDFLIHVMDASSPDLIAHYETTTTVLSELGADEKKQLLVLNKIDLVDEPDRLLMFENRFPGALRISVKTGEGIDELKSLLSGALQDRVRRMELLIPHGRQDLVARLHEHGKVIKEEYLEEGARVSAIVPARLFKTYEEVEIDGE